MDDESFQPTHRDLMAGIQPLVEKTIFPLYNCFGIFVPRSHDDAVVPALQSYPHSIGSDVVPLPSTQPVPAMAPR